MIKLSNAGYWLRIKFKDMKFKRLFFTIMKVCTTGILVTGCGNKNEWPDEVNVNKDMDMAIYAATEVDGKFLPVEPALLQENVSLDKLLHYDRDGDLITVPFQFKDSTEYAKITEENIDRHIVITADGEVVSVPVVRMRIGNGACSFMLTKEQAQKLFPKDKIEELLSGSD